MAELASGAEYDLSSRSQWETLRIGIGNVVEVELLTSSFAVDEEEWAALLVTQVQVTEDGSLVLAVRFLGSMDPSTGERLGGQLEGAGYVHLCREEPCQGVEDEHAGYIHVNHIRLWDFSHFMEICDYLTNAQIVAAEAMKRELAQPRSSPGAGRRPARRPPRPKETKPPKPSGRRGNGASAPEGSAPPEAGMPRALGEEARKKLRKRLEQVKAKALGGDHPDRLEEPPLEEAANANDGAAEVSDSAEESLELGEGDRLPGAGPLADLLGLGDLSKPHKTKKESAIPKVTRDTTMKPVKDRLVRKALAVAAEQVQQKNEQKKKKKRPSNKKQKALVDLASSLQTLITGKTAAGTSASSKKKKRRRKTLPDGTIESWSVSSSASSETDQAEESDSEMDLETPVRKKSRDHPGSILRMLTDHVRETLEQGATTSLTETGNSVTSGVKVMTYFMLHLRPSFNTYLKEMREMHHIAAVLDTIRKGDISRAADALAARFMALHQSMLDQNWATARHMEIFPMQETSAVGPSLVLATRKHSRLVDKVSGSYQAGGWPGKGRGKGYKGDWQSLPDSRPDGKGAKGKGKKGKGKARGKGSWDWNQQNNDWKDNKEKPAEKTA